MIMSLITLSDGVFLSHFSGFIMSNIPGLLHLLFFVTDFLIRANELFRLSKPNTILGQTLMKTLHRAHILTLYSNKKNQVWMNYNNLKNSECTWILF